jgi:hypothetical protein
MCQVPGVHAGPVRGHGLQPGLLSPRAHLRKQAAPLLALGPIQGDQLTCSSVPLLFLHQRIVIVSHQNNQLCG